MSHSKTNQLSIMNKRAVVTAGASGIGLAIANCLAANGAKVHVCDVDDNALSQLPEGIHGTRVDVSDPEQVANWLSPIADEGVDILVNNAGVKGPTARIEDTDPLEYRQCIAVSLDSHLFAAKAIVPSMKRLGGGSIINITSTAGFLGLPNRSAYCAAKFAVVGFTKTWAMELGRDSIRVNAIAPGAVNGDRMERVIQAQAEDEGIDEETVRKLNTIGMSMASFVDPEEIGNMVLFLSSDLGQRISGQVIAVDGHTETLYPRFPD